MRSLEAIAIAFRDNFEVLLPDCLTSTRTVSEIRKSSDRPTFEMVSLVRPHLRLFLFGMLALAGGSAINLLFPEIVRWLLEEGHLQLLRTHPSKVAGGILGLLGIQALCFYFRSYYFGVVGQKVAAEMRADLFSRLIRQNIEFFDRERAADLVSRLGTDIALIQDAVSIKLSVFIRYTFQVVVGVVLMVYLSPRLTLTILIAIPVIVGLSLILGRRLRSASKQQQAALASASVIAEETFSGARIVKAFSRERYEHGRYASAIARVLALGLQRTEISAFFQSFASFLMNASIVLVLLYGIYLVGHGNLSVGDLSAFLLLGVIVAVSFAFVAGGYSEFMQSVGASERIFELRALPDFELSEGSRALPAESSGEVQFEQVSFAYPTRPELEVLHDLTFSVPPGKRTALVGPSGSGKSTVVNLILRFYDASSGTIRFSGIESRELALSELRQKIAIVPQDAQLFAVSIAENLRYGKPDATTIELEEACARANILDFIRSLPEGLETNVGNRGVQISGGQKQRLAIARAMLRNPALLILDEATSSLDSENEYLIQGALNELTKGRTSLIIAHRLATIRSADQLLVLEHGRLVQSGSHEVLSSTPGLYRRMVERQELHTEPQR